LEPRRDVVEVVKACGNTSDTFVSFVQFVDEVETFLNDRINGGERPIQFPLDDAEHRPLREIEQVINGRGAFVPACENFRGGMDQLSQQRFVAHNLAVVANIGGAGHALHELG
jgi:hypothetical protein